MINDGYWLAQILEELKKITAHLGIEGDEEE
jgi:hypothetical protein